MDSEETLTKQGVRNLNSLGPKKEKKPRAGEGQRAEGGGEPASVPEHPVAEVAVVVAGPSS
jgi:hypothetical protein